MTHFGVYLDLHGDPTLRIGHIKSPAKLLIQPRIIGLPDLLPNIQLAEIQMTAIKGQINLAAVHRFVQSLSAAEDLEDAPALFVTAESVAIKDDSVTGLHGIIEADRHAVAKHIRNSPQQDASFGGTHCRNQHLMIATIQPARRETSGKRLFHFRDLASSKLDGPSGHCGINGFAIVASNIGDVFRSLQASFDFEGANSGIDEFASQRKRRQILRA